MGIIKSPSTVYACVGNVEFVIDRLQYRLPKSTAWIDIVAPSTPKGRKRANAKVAEVLALDYELVLDGYTMRKDGTANRKVCEINCKKSQVNTRSVDEQISDIAPTISFSKEYTVWSVKDGTGVKAGTVNGKHVQDLIRSQVAMGYSQFNLECDNITKKYSLQGVEKDARQSAAQIDILGMEWDMWTITNESSVTTTRIGVDTDKLGFDIAQLVMETPVLLRGLRWYHCKADNERFALNGSSYRKIAISGDHEVEDIVTSLTPFITELKKVKTVDAVKQTATVDAVKPTATADISQYVKSAAQGIYRLFSYVDGANVDDSMRVCLKMADDMMEYGLKVIKVPNREYTYAVQGQSFEELESFATDAIKAIVKVDAQPEFDLSVFA